MCDLCNGVLCGVIAVTAMSGLVDPWVGIIGGILSAPVFFFLDRLLLHLMIDDVAATVPMHFGVGLLGVLLTGFFAKEDHVISYYGAVPGSDTRRWVSSGWRNKQTQTDAEGTRARQQRLAVLKSPGLGSGLGVCSCLLNVTDFTVC